MNKITPGLEALGFSSSFQDQTDPKDLDEFELARVMAVHRDSYVINTGELDIQAELIGKFHMNASSPTDLPAVGDWVLASLYDNNTFSTLHKVIARKSLLKRKTAGKTVDYQVIAANIDVAFIVQGLDSDFNLSRLERYIVMVRDSNIEPIILLSKSDLLDPEVVEEQVARIYETMPLLQVLPFSNKDPVSLAGVKELLAPQKTYCLLGSSGVGKTSLLNRLIGEDVYSTKTVRERDGRGRHATTHRQLVKLESGALLIDTPGMRELGTLSVTTGIDETFSEITELSKLCQFNDCNHVNEKGCAVLAAVKAGELPEKRYQNYLKMNKESQFNEMSYLERRQKDRQFGKFRKSVSKHKPNKRGDN